jgi:hypothetical protein
MHWAKNGLITLVRIEPLKPRAEVEKTVSCTTQKLQCTQICQYVKVKSYIYITEDRVNIEYYINLSTHCSFQPM